MPNLFTRQTLTKRTTIQLSEAEVRLIIAEKYDAKLSEVEFDIRSNGLFDGVVVEKVETLEREKEGDEWA